MTEVTSVHVFSALLSLKSIKFSNHFNVQIFKIRVGWFLRVLPNLWSDCPKVCTDFEAEVAIFFFFFETKQMNFSQIEPQENVSCWFQAHRWKKWKKVQKRSYFLGVGFFKLLFREINVRFGCYKCNVFLFFSNSRIKAREEMNRDGYML